MKITKPDQTTRSWIDARKKHHLSHLHIQMARELGVNPKKFGGIDNHRQEPWKLPLPQFIEELYWKRFGRERPDVGMTVEQLFQRDQEKKAQTRERKLQAMSQRIGAAGSPSTALAGPPDELIE